MLIFQLFISFGKNYFFFLLNNLNSVLIKEILTQEKYLQSVSNFSARFKLRKSFFLIYFFLLLIEIVQLCSFRSTAIIKREGIKIHLNNFNQKQKFP